MTTQPGTIEDIGDVPLSRASAVADRVNASQAIIGSRILRTVGRSAPGAGDKSEYQARAFTNAASTIGKQLKLLPQRLIAIATFLCLWEIAPTVGLVDPAFIPPPSVVFVKLLEFLYSGTLFKHGVASLQRAALGYAIAVLTAVPIGFLVGWSKNVEKYLDPLLQTLRQMPILALFPVFILFLGIGERSKAAMVALACFWSIFLNTVNGVLGVDPLLVKTARAMNVPGFSMFRKVVLPAAVPSIFTGLRYAGTVALLVLVSVEMIGAEKGLGYWVMNAEQRFSTPEMFAGIVSLTIIGVTVNYSLEALEKRMTRWKEAIIKR